MAANVVVVASEKGGVGKSTDVINLSSMLHKMGESVLVVDADPQKSISDWSAKASEDSVTVVLSDKSLKNDINKLRRAFDWIIIDCPGKLEQITLDAIKVADVVLIPYSPSQLDVWGNASMIELIKARQEVTDGLPKTALIINMFDKKNNVSKGLRESLEVYELPILKQVITRRVAYIETIVDGKSAADLPEDNQAHFEVKMLTKELREFTKNG